MLLYADDLESMGHGAKGRQGIPLSYLFLAALGFPSSGLTWLVKWLRSLLLQLIGGNLLSRLYGLTVFTRNLGYLLRLQLAVKSWKVVGNTLQVS